MREIIAMVSKSFFEEGLQSVDLDVSRFIDQELDRQQNTLELIASENIVSRAVLEASGSVLTNKYAEGYPHRRYYCGCEYVDGVEQLAIDRAKALFSCLYANVQPHSGSQANQGVFMALLQPGDTFLGLDLASGGHLTHGGKPNQSGKWFHAVSYGVSRETGVIDFDEVEALAKEHKPRLIIAGGSAYPRAIDFKRFREIADSVEAYLMVDMAHFAGLVAGGAHANPLDYAHVVTTTTHKTLRGPRGGMILTNDEAIAKKINSAIFPGIQGGPLMQQIAAKAVAFKEALTDDFKEYAAKVVENASVLASVLKESGLGLVADGTDTHVILVDLRPLSVTGNIVADSLHRAGITCNKNGIPFDPEGPTVTSGIRLGTPALTTRGMGTEEMKQVGRMIVDVIKGVAEHGTDNHEVEKRISNEVKELCARFPIYHV